MQYSINTRELLRAYPNLTEEMLMTKSFGEILSLLKEIRIKKDEDLKYLDKDFQMIAKQICFSVYDKFAGYVPDEVLFKAIYSYVKDKEIEERRHWRKFPGTIYTREENGEYIYKCYVGYDDIICEKVVVNDILKYYYPCFSFLPYHISRGRLDDIFDYIFVYDVYDIEENGPHLVVSLMDIIEGDVEAIINANISHSTSDSYKDIVFSFFNTDFVMDFIDIIKNKRNKDAIYNAFPIKSKRMEEN